MDEPNMSNRAQVTPLPEQTCKRFFRDLMLGLEYCTFKDLLVSAFQFPISNWLQIFILNLLINLRQILLYGLSLE